MRVDVSMLLELVQTEQLSGVNSVVIDVLRASNTIVSALECNIPYMLPVATIAEALAVAEQLGGACYLGGERNRLRPEGFHFGNSPLEYRQISESLPVVYTTTNGTRALQRVKASHRVLVGSLRNAAAIAEVLCASGDPVLLVCCGTKGKVSAEDVYCAGAIIHEMQSRAAIELTDAAKLALHAFLQVADDLQTALLTTENGHGLCQIGFGDDVRYVAELNASSLVPQFANEKLTARLN